VFVIDQKLVGFNFEQLIADFVTKECISFDGGRPAEILLGRDTRPSGQSLLEAAKKVMLLTSCTSINYLLLFLLIFSWLLKF